MAATPYRVIIESVKKLMLITVNTTISRPPVLSILQILTTFYLYSGRPRMGLSVNNKQKIRQTVVKISREGGVCSPWPDMFKLASPSEG